MDFIILLVTFLFLAIFIAAGCSALVVMTLGIIDKRPREIVYGLVFTLISGYIVAHLGQAVISWAS